MQIFAKLYFRLIIGLVYDFNATFNNISVISWRSALLMEETEENPGHVVSHWQTLMNMTQLPVESVRFSS
jgi:hypothetical protein